jgi:outer membrane lipoprotein SlyB
MTLAFEQIEDSHGQLQSISARPVTLQAESKTRGDVERIVGGGALGAIIGGIAGGGKGAAIGAGAGAGAGTVLMLATKGEDVELNAGQRLNVYTTSPTSIVLVAMK